MSVRSGQGVTVEFTTSSPTTQAAANADSTPAGTLVVNGTDNAAAVTVTNVDTGRYKAAVTLPTLAIGDVVELSVAATVGGVAGKAIVWRDTKDVLLDAGGKVTDNQQTGDVYALANGGSGFAAIKSSVGSPQQTGSAVTLPANPPAGFIVAASIAAAALNGKGDWNTVVPDNADVVTALADLVLLLARTDPTTALAAVKAKTDNLPADPAGLAALAAAHGAGSWAPDNTTLAHLATALELNAGSYRFTVDALANAPAGGGSSDHSNILAIKARTDLLGAGISVMTAPVMGDGSVRLMRGAAYLARDGLSLRLVAPAGGWPDLTGASVRLNTTGLSYPGTVLTPSGLNATVQVELTAAQTAVVTPGPCQWWATLANGDGVPLSGACSLALLAAVGS